MSRRKTIRWSRQAELDLQSAHAYLNERNSAAAQRFAIEILETVDRIQRHLQIGPVAADLVPRGRYRHVPWKRHRIIYRIDGALIWILRVWDCRRNPGA